MSSIFDRAPRFPFRNTSGDDIDRLTQLVVYGVEQADDAEDENPYRFLATKLDGGTIYGDVATQGLWPWPRLIGISQSKVANGDTGDCVLDTMPVLARVKNPTDLDLGSPADDVRNRAPLATDIDGNLTTLFRATTTRYSGADDTDVTDFSSLGSLAVTGADLRFTALWHNLGGIREFDNGDWLCCVARMPSPILRGHSIEQIPIHDRGWVDLVSSLGLSWDSGDIADENLRMPFRVRARNEYATIAADRFVQVTHVDGQWFLTAAEC